MMLIMMLIFSLPLTHYTRRTPLDPSCTADRINSVQLSQNTYHAGQDVLTVNWQSSNQHHYFFYLYDAAGENPVNTADFLTEDCVAGVQQARMVV